VGGYPRGTERIKNLNPDMAYAVDLIGLQFQQPYNTGRLVLIAPPGSPLPQGKFDNELFEKIVSEPKASYAQAEADNTGRYRKICAFGADHYLDTDAYAQFVKQHFISVALALHQRAVEDGTSGISFKFTRYGAGYFSKGIGLDTDEAESVKTQLEKEMEAEKPGLTARLRKKALEDKEIAAISDSMQKEMAINNKIQVLRTKELDSRVALVREGITEECILKGIILALEKLAQENKATAISKIKRIELPYYAGATRSKDEIKKIEERCLALGIEFVCKKEDILKKTSKNTSAFTLATDSNAAARNEGSCGSLGAYGYESITGRGYHSNVHINQKMLERTATNRLYSSLTPQEQQAVCLERAKDAVQRYLREVEGLNSSSWGKHGEKGKDKARQVIGCKNVQELIKVLKEINAEAKEKSILAKAGVTEHSLSSYLVKSLSGIVGMDMANELLTSTRNKVMLDRIVPELEKIVLPLFAGETAGLTRAM